MQDGIWRGRRSLGHSGPAFFAIQIRRSSEGPSMVSNCGCCSAASYRAWPMRTATRCPRAGAPRKGCRPPPGRCRAPPGVPQGWRTSQDGHGADARGPTRWRRSCRHRRSRALAPSGQGG
eukprot:15224890-Alexandrium_andersonii.AAC.1